MERDRYFSIKKYTCFLRGLFFVSLCLLLSGVIYAEEAEFELNQIRRTESEKKLADELTQKGKEKRFQDKLARIPYSEILKDPDNFKLNYLYAQQQVASNNLLGAAATLERILLVHPELAKIRLFYAVVLFRLDNLIEAQNELERLSELKMPDSLRKEMKLYIKEIKKRQRSTHFGIRQANGFQLDTNRNAAPKSKKQFFFGVPLGLQGSNKKRMDTSFINVTTMDGRHDLGFQAGHDVFGSFTYYRGEQTIVDSLDIASYQYEIGSTLKSRFFNFTPSFQHNVVELSGQLFLRTVSGNI